MRVRWIVPDELVVALVVFLPVWVGSNTTCSRIWLYYFNCYIFVWFNWVRSISPQFFVVIFVFILIYLGRRSSLPSFCLKKERNESVLLGFFYNKKSKHFGTLLILTCTGTLMSCIILICQQITFNIEKLINTICTEEFSSKRNCVLLGLKIVSQNQTNSLRFEWLINSLKTNRSIKFEFDLKNK
jgi:hypothetical protein